LIHIPKKKVSGIVLAAGSATRMGKTKQLLPFGKTNILGQVIQNACQSKLHEIIVVLGHEADKIQKTIDLSGIRTVFNKDYQMGQSTSLIAGLEAISSDCDGAIFLLGDQPLVTSAIINRLFQSFETSKSSSSSNASRSSIVIPYFHGQRGNPVIIARSLFYRIKSLSGDTGPRVLFDEFKDVILKVSISDEAILIDVDTKEDYERLVMI
jgi:molybdenum cofactor cytidylyltransferase